MVIWIHRRMLEVKLILFLNRLHKLVLYPLPLQILVLMKLVTNLNKAVRTLLGLFMRVVN